jgi:hypothetical protein
VTGPRAQLTAHRRRLLERLAANTRNRAVADMARDLLSGRRTPRDVSADPVLSEELSKGVAKFGQWYEKLSEKEKDQAAEVGAQRLATEAAEAAEATEATEATEAPAEAPAGARPKTPAPRRRHRPRPAAADYDDYSDESPLRRD